MMNVVMLNVDTLTVVAPLAIVKGVVNTIPGLSSFGRLPKSRGTLLFQNNLNFLKFLAAVNYRNTILDESLTGLQNQSLPVNAQKTGNLKPGNTN
jgi:hypothetical protein